MVCARCGERLHWVCLNRRCVNPLCVCFLAGIRFNSRNCDIECEIEHANENSILRDNPEVVDFLKETLLLRANGTYKNTVYGYVDTRLGSQKV